MLLSPLPLRAQNRRQVRLQRLPTKHQFRSPWIRHQSRRIACARAFDSRCNRPSRNLTRALDHFHYRISVPGPEIQEIRLAAATKMFERANMCIGKIGDVDVIADRRSIRSRIVRPEYRDFLLFFRSRLQHIRHKMRFRLMIFTASLGSSRSVEISQRNGFQPIGSVVARQQSLHQELRPAIGIYRPLRTRLGNRDLIRLAIRGAR